MTKILNYGWLGILAAGETVQLSRKDLLAAPREYHTTVLFCMKKLRRHQLLRASVTCQLAHVDLMGLYHTPTSLGALCLLLCMSHHSVNHHLHNTLNIHPQ